MDWLDNILSLISDLLPTSRTGCLLGFLLLLLALVIILLFVK